MKLEKGFIIDGRVKGKKILGIMFGSYVLYENTNYWSMIYTRNDDGYGNPTYPLFNSDFEHTTKAVKNSDSTFTITITAKNIDDMPTFIQFNNDGLAEYLISVDSIADTYGITGINFGGCNLLKSVDVSNIDTSNTTYMFEMFSGCEYLTSLDLSRFDTSKAINMAYMFRGCIRLTTLNLSNFTVTEDAGVSQILSGCRNLAELRLDNCDNYTISRIINSDGFPTGTLSGGRVIYFKESELGDLEEPDGWSFSFIPEEEPEPEEPEVPVDPPIPDEPEEPEIPLYTVGEFQGDTTLTEVKTKVDSSHINLNYMFENCSNLVSVNTEDWDTSNVTTMRNMFSGCTSLVELDLSNWKTVQVADEDNMWWMFYGCSSLEFLDLSNWDLTYSADLHYAFHGCDKLHTIKLDNCDLSTIEIIISSNGFTTNAIEGITRTIYVDKSLVITDGNIVDGIITCPPTNWVFEHMPE